MELSLDEAFQAIVRGAVEESFAPLEASLRRISARFSGDVEPVRAAPRPTPRPQSAPTPPPPPPAVKAVTENVACAIVGCKRPSRSKGYCSAHYQKRRNLVATGRLPASWQEFAAPQSIPDIALPRGRAASRERAPKPQAVIPPPAPTGPRVWVRKKGQPQLTEAIPGSSDGTTQAPILTPSILPLAAKGVDVESTVKRWAAEFLADKRPR
ncbi:cell wall protein [Myxococcus sp. K15C18031901]|uniref:cell wall protein n=1 Tax=Myxococcus dinghuensis TaxID=2906761 RepID=UPI0020A6EA58|nr:cell wall protein [Myxococcus dinghuensis]MCP3099920.1 cell wall protein [Myxococcus dinghuensis]